MQYPAVCRRSRWCVMCNSFTNYVVRRLMMLMEVLMVLLVSQVSWWPLLRDKLSQPVAVAELDDQTEEKTGHCEAHGGLWRSERPELYLYSPLPSPHLSSSNIMSASVNFTLVRSSLFLYHCSREIILTERIFENILSYPDWLLRAYQKIISELF